MSEDLVAAACAIVAFHIFIYLSHLIQLHMQCFSSPAAALFGRCIRLSLFSANIRADETFR